MIYQSEAAADGLRRISGAGLLVVLCASWAISCGGTATPHLAEGGVASETPATGTPAPARVSERTIAGDAMRIAIRGDTDAADAAGELALVEAERLAGLLLAEISASEIDVLNRVPSHVFIQLSAETASALGRALAIAEESDGAYDPTTPPLLDLWGVRTGAAKIPRQFEIDIALRKVDWLDLELGKDGTSARRLSRRTEIDLGPVARGAVIDGALAVLRNAGVSSASIRWSSVTTAFGGTPEAPWSFEVVTAASERLATLELTEGAAALIVPRRQLEGPNGERIHEWMDARTGRPAAAANAAAATARDAASAGGYALAVFAMGREAAEWVAEREGVEALLELNGGERWASPGANVRWAD
jgi:thiamine biosynthesis lipoprotein